MARNAAKQDAVSEHSPKAGDRDFRLIGLDDQKSIQHSLSSGRVSVGSAPDNDLVIADSTVSKRHAIVRKRFGRVRVSDFASTNGTFVDGRRVRKSARVDRGAELRFGAVRFALVAPAGGRVRPLTIAALLVAMFAVAFAVTYYRSARRLEAELRVAQTERAAAVEQAARARLDSPPRAWLAQLNHYRALAKLKPVVEDSALSDGDLRHAEYLVKNHAEAVKRGANLGADAHTEDRSTPFYSDAGRAAAEASNVAQTTLPPAGSLPPVWAIDFWMEGPFHRLPILNPGLARVGYGESCAQGMCAAALNVNAGAPAPLAEGAAAFFDYPHFFAQQYLKEGKLDSVARFITTYRYRQLPPEKALMETASFVRFLVEHYGAGMFEKLYRGATDLSVKTDLQKIYGQNLDSLEAEWRHHLGAFIPEAGPLRKLAKEDFWNYRFRDALGLYLKAMALDSFPKPEDYEDIATQYYNLGRYDSALTFYEKAYGADPKNWERAYVVGNFFLLRDDTIQANVYYRKVLDLDSSAADGLAREGTYFFESGDFFKAESLYRVALKKRTRPNDLAELNLNLGYIAYRLKGDFTKGNEYLNAAWGFYRKVRNEAPGVPYPYWRLGELFLYKNMPDSAEANLKFALFLETRPYYLAKLFIRLGNLFDVLNQRRRALEYYQQVLELPAAPLDWRRAQAYLKKPFRLSAN